MASDLPPARTVRFPPLDSAPAGRVVLTHEERHLRRRRLVTEAGQGFLADLPEAVRLAPGSALVLEDGRLVEVAAAPEPLLEVRGGDRARLAWHIGNRHAACRIEADRLLIRRDHVLAAMLRGLGAELREVEEPFEPEGGAYAHAHGDHRG
ncbi:urease accessory protein UreE [Rubellimicrobium sp. CFH 75288]|uniref:urease accessory protein UreE n=1 Tax=Rubellimicrobium sp. CFH 75288 TaxID=2697034 RepID=UPI00352AA098